MEDTEMMDFENGNVSSDEKEEDESPDLKKKNMPRELQPLLTFPLRNGDKTFKIEQNLETKEGIPNPNGKLARYLVNSAGNLRYFGESNPLSFLQECRAVFDAVQGSSHFTTDPKIAYVHDDPDKVKLLYPVPMPSKSVCRLLVKFFKENINDTFYVFDMAYFEEQVVNKFYRSPTRFPSEKLCLLYLVLAVGALFAETSQVVLIDEIKDLDPSVFFDSAVLIQRTLAYDGLLWQVEAHFLMHFYLQGMSKRTLSWVNLGIAIRFAQGLGMHRRAINEKYSGASYNIHRRRLWMSIFICDRVSSINLGRPLGINYYEWDDFRSINILSDPIENLRLRCQSEISQVAGINGKIVENLYQDGVISLKRASDLAVELKHWSHKLPVDLNLKTTFLKIAEPDDNHINYLLVFVHLSQFYGIMLLCKPFLMHVLLRKLKPLLVGDIKNEEFLLHFCKAAIKASFLTINLSSRFVNNNPERLELFVTINCCFFASLILGFTLFEQTRQRVPNKEYIKVLKSSVERGRKVLYDFGAFNASAERWSENLKNMLAAIFSQQSSPISSIASLDSIKDDFEIFNEEIVRMEIGDNGESDELISFQNTFVPSAFGAMSEVELDSTNLEGLLFPDVFMYQENTYSRATVD